MVVVVFHQKLPEETGAADANGPQSAEGVRTGPVPADLTRRAQVTQARLQRFVGST